MELLARYARCLDSGDLDGYVNNFAPDGNLFGNHVGHAQIREYVGQVIERRKADPARRMHFVGFPVIEGNGQRVTVHSYLLWIQLGAESPISAAAEYADECVKQDGRWVFQSRALTRLAGRD
jgi:SnoaL-like protein